MREIPEPLTQGDVHVWVWSFDGFDGLSDGDLSILDREERDRTARFHFAPDRIQYSVSHANVRRILGAYRGVAPESLVFTSNAHGKPRLSGIRGLSFNLSHCQSVGVLAVARDLELGIDVEDIRPVEATIAESHFSQRELADLAALRDADWVEGFYRCWTRKEALLKAEGFGLGIPLDAFDVSLAPSAVPALLGSRSKAGFPTNWTLHDLVVADGVAGALAVSGGAATVSCFALTSL